MIIQDNFNLVHEKYIKREGFIYKKCPSKKGYVEIPEDIIDLMDNPIESRNIDKLKRDNDDDLIQKAEDFARDMNLIFKYNDLPMEISQFSSLMYLKFKEDVPYSDVLFADMRRQGIHIYAGRPMFFTTAHNDADIEAIKQEKN